MSLQAERWLAAGPVELTSGTAANITLRASSDMTVDLRRLILQIGAYKPAGSTDQLSPTFQDGNSSTEISSILVKDAIQLLRGVSSPTASAALFSPLRAFNSVPLAAAGSALPLASGEPIVITIKQTGGIDSIAALAVPCVLASDKGRNYLPAGYAPTQAQTILGSAASTGTASSGKVDFSSHTVKFSEAGVAFLHDAQILAYATAQNTANNQNAPVNLAAGAYVSKLQGVSQDQYVVGTPDTSGNPLGVPLLAFAPGGMGYRPNSWCKLPAQPGSSANEVIADVTAYGDGIGSCSMAMSLGFQAAGAGGTIPVCL